MKKIVISWLFAFFLFVPLASATSIIFQENFESYDEGSNLSETAAWSGDRTLVGYSDPFESMVANGRLRAGLGGQAWSTHVFAEALDVTKVYTLTFNAYATTELPESHNSGVTFHSIDTPNVAGWWMANNPAAGAGSPSPDFVGWLFDVRYLAGNSSLYSVDGGFDQIVTLSVIIDPLNLEVYGIANFGSGSLETPRYPIILDRFFNIDGVSVEQDYRLGGAEFDNINLASAPVPEPPIADAGLDQVVFDEVTLDGSGSYDPDSEDPLSYQWKLSHRVDPNNNRDANVVDPTVSNLASGFYDVELTVEDSDGLTGTDMMLLAAAGPCTITDLDEDGYSIDMGDCDDNDNTVYPNAPELCDEKDNDCDGQIDEGFDIDEDGYTVCGGDCNDTDPSINPDAVELPGNGIDENCDGSLGACDPDPNELWKNHGEYVRCVAQEVEQLVNAGTITEEEGDKLVSSAAQSDVGKK